MEPTGESSGKTLIIDNDEAFIQALKAESDGVQFIFTSQLNQGITRVSSNVALRAIVVSQDVDLQWVFIVRACHQHKPGVPILVTGTGRSQLDPAELKKIGVHAYLAKPLTATRLQQVMEDVGPPPEKSAAEQYMQVIDETNPTTRRALLDDQDFLAIPVTNLATNTKVSFSLHLRIAPGHYVCFVRKNGVFTPEDAEKHRTKGIVSYFIKKDEQRTYLSYCDEMITQTFKLAQPEVKLAKVRALGFETLRFFSQAGMGSQDVALAENFAARSYDLIYDRASSSQILKDFLLNASLQEHGVSVTMIAGLILKNLNAIKPDIYNPIAIGCLLHDISLLSAPEILQAEDMAKMSEEEKALFMQHPDTSGTMLRKLASLPTAVIDAVRVHHFRLGQHGFGSEAQNVKQVNRIGELIGISEELSHLVRKGDGKSQPNPLLEMAKLESQFSRPIMQAFQATFMKVF